jgi:hypothetical protein
MLEKEVWYVPPVGGNLPVEPTCILTYDQPTLAIVEVEPDPWQNGSSTGWVRFRADGNSRRMTGMGAKQQ